MTNRFRFRTKLQPQPNAEAIETVYVEPTDRAVPQEGPREVAQSRNTNTQHQVDPQVAALWLNCKSTESGSENSHSSVENHGGNRKVSCGRGGDWNILSKSSLFAPRQSQRAEELLQSVSDAASRSRSPTRGPRQPRRLRFRRSTRPDAATLRKDANVSSATCENVSRVRSSGATTTPGTGTAFRAEAMPEAPPSKWRGAVDPSTQRTYYYHTETRETQWRKPMELCSPEERQEMEAKEAKQREFFAAMEANILRNFNAGTSLNPSGETSEGEEEATAMATATAPKRPSLHQVRHPASRSLKRTGSVRRSSLVRTISTMDETVITDLVNRVPSFRNMLHNSDQDISFIPGEGSPDMRPLSRQSSQMMSIEEAISESAANAIDLNELTIADSGLIRRKQQQREPSFGTLLNILPEEESTTERQSSFYGSSALDESSFNLGLSDVETEALARLAETSDTITRLSASEPFDVLLTDIGEESTETNGDSSHASNNDNNITEATPKVSNQHLRHSLPPQLDRYGSMTSLYAENGNDKNDDNDDRPREDLGESISNSNGFSLEFSPEPVTPKNATTTTTTTKPSLSRQGSSSSTSRSNNTSGMMDRPTIGKRRNTCGTLYVATTMADPDKDATIKCICGVFRAHILQSEFDQDGVTEAYRIFNDLESQQRTSRKQQFRPKVDFVVQPPAPSLEEITTFYRDVFIRAQMETDCIIMSLIYVERLIKVTEGRLRPRVGNWRSILFSCMLLSSKVWDDMSMWNADFSQTCPAGVRFSLQRINALEIAVLDSLSYKVKVPASEYAKYYFLLRSMIIKSGLAGQDLLQDRPLDIDGARRLQAVSERYQVGMSKPGVGLANFRSKSVGDCAIDADRDNPADPEQRKIGLEHLVNM